LLLHFSTGWVLSAKSGCTNVSVQTDLIHSTTHQAWYKMWGLCSQPREPTLHPVLTFSSTAITLKY